MPVRKDLTCYKGQTYSQDMFFKQDNKVYPLTGITAKAQIRPSENSTILTAELDCTVSAEEGKLNLALDAETTAALNPGTYAWDLKATDENDEIRYWVKGHFIVEGRVTV